MRTLTLASIALAATLAAGGIARADETVSRENAESVAVAAESAREVTQSHAVAPLGYATPSASHVEAIFAQPTHRAAPAASQSADALFLEQGDRGLGTN